MSAAPQGDKYMKKGDDALNSWNIFKSNNSKYEEARDYYEKAAVQYKSNSVFDKAGEAYERFAAMVAKIPGEMKDIDYARGMEDAGKMYLNAHKKEKAKAMFVEAAEAYGRTGKRGAATAFEAAADACEDRNEKKELLLRAYASHREKGSKVSATSILTKVAFCDVQGYAFQSAMDLFDQLGRDALDDSLTRVSAFRTLFLALLANLAQLGGHQQPALSVSPGEVLANLRQRFSLYQQLDTNFTKNCREHMLITEILQAIDAGSVEAYDAAVKSFRKVCPIEAPQQLMLKEGREGITSANLIL